MKKQTEDFFKSLIEKTGTYYLSDYVENYGEFDSDIIPKDEHKEIVKQRDYLKKECEKVGLDIHVISCNVAQKFMEKYE